MTTVFEAATKYIDARRRFDESGLAAQPEAQLTVPVHDLLVEMVDAVGLGDLELFREAQLAGVIPDFAALFNGRPCGWVELKAPGHAVDGTKWRGREKKQWELLSELDSLIVTNGTEIVLYAAGVPTFEALLPMQDAAKWDGKALEDLLRQFISLRPSPVVRVSQLAGRLAPLARMLRERLATGLKAETPSLPIQKAKAAWTTHVHEGASDETFATDLAQVIAYSLAIAALRGGADRNDDSFISLGEARDALRGPNDMLAAALGPALEVPGLLTELRNEVGAIERLVSAVDNARISRSRDARGEPWLWFYEDFLQKYDAKARKEAGVYYTPAPVVQTQVRLVGQILTEVLGRPLGFGDPNIVTLDPATGSGTYPLSVLDEAAKTAVSERGPAGPRQVAQSLARNLIAFELMPGPYAVAHLRIGQRLSEIAETLTPPEHVRVYLTDTLDDPEGNVPALGLWGDAAVLAEERERASKVKSNQPVTVVMGNPPYKRRTAESGGGWVLHPRHGAKRLFDDVIKPAQDAGVIFSAMRSLYDDYVYFWRWALWKGFEQEPEKPAVVSFITSSSWLRGPAFLGLRRLARLHADEIWIIDLGGGSRGAIKDDNVFAIQTPVAIVTLFRRASSKDAPSNVRYRKVEGSTAAKLAALEEIQAPHLNEEAWATLDVPADSQLIPQTGNSEWHQQPALVDIFPWQQPGVNFGRSWAVSPSKDVLKRRWVELMRRTDSEERATAFVTARTGRNIHTSVAGMPRLSELSSDAPHRDIVPLAYRSFDRQWTFKDPRLALLERPSLWASVSDDQLFFVTSPTDALSPGQPLVATTAVPDFHHFRGRGGKDVLPLFRDQSCKSPNVTKGLLEVLSSKFGCQVRPEDLAAYVFALLGHPGYHKRFANELLTPGPRVPLTADPELFAQAVRLGTRLLWIQTQGARFSNPEEGRPKRIPSVPGLAWLEPVSRIPSDMSEVVYDPASNRLTIGTGIITGVRHEVWNYSTSGFAVVQRWIGSRTARGVGRASSPRYATPLDLIRPTEWEDQWNDEILTLLTSLTLSIDVRDEQDQLLSDVLASETILAAELPTPSAEERAAPRA